MVVTHSPSFIAPFFLPEAFPTALELLPLPEAIPLIWI